MINISCRISWWLQDPSPPPQCVHCVCCWLGAFVSLTVLPQQPARHIHRTGRSFVWGSTTSSERFICTHMIWFGAVLYILHCTVTSFALSNFTHGICVSGSDVLQLFSSTLFCVTLLCKSEHEWGFLWMPNWHLGWKWLRCSPQTEKSGSWLSLIIQTSELL